VSAPAFPRRPFAGIAVYVTTRREAEEFAAWPRDLLERMSSAELIVSVNAASESLRATTRLLQRLEGCHVLLSHLGQPDARKVAPGRRDVERLLGPALALESSARVGVKLSGLYSISSPAHAYPHAVVRPFVECLAERFGAKRLYWGSDFSPALDYVSFVQTIDAVAAMPWSQAERSAVMGGNLRRLVSSAPERTDPRR
jgi:predicted TIM-barrel fold metal-dependent hydrolase